MLFHCSDAIIIILHYIRSQWYTFREKNFNHFTSLYQPNEFIPSNHFTFSGMRNCALG